MELEMLRVRVVATTRFQRYLPKKRVQAAYM